MTTDRRASPADTVVLPFLIVEVRLVKKTKKAEGFSLPCTLLM